MRVETIITPTLLPLYSLEGKRVVVIDVLRATSSICTALRNGAKALIPVASEQEAHRLIQQGLMLASEREGIRRDYAQIGNSPHEFSPERVRGKLIAYFTTNGTHAIHAASVGEQVIIASFLNRAAALQYLLRGPQTDVILLCSGWKGLFNIEDTLLAGALAEGLLSHGYTAECDATLMATELWRAASPDLVSYCERVVHRARLGRLGLAPSFYDCLHLDTIDIVPTLRDGRIIA